MRHLPAISFSLLAQFLTGLGFEHKAVEDPFEVFENQDRHALILLRPMEAEDMLTASQWASIRHTLLGKEVISATELREWVQSLDATGGKMAS
ncbi:MAG TPA: hypothetical protein DCE41_23400 [Cytophagales bacterium]|nr:hypothetical protein [Cytophagales bacterium]HAA21584.1 hypothetical protein [Cytophagales bacterium]HAP62294.1 hypothetical protein [Cytophagales bacterium]